MTCPSGLGAAGRPRPAAGHGAGVLGRKSARQAARELVRRHALAHPAWGHRKIWAMVRHDGHVFSEASVLRILRDEGLILPAEYQWQRRRLAERRKVAFATEPSGANQVWRLDFSEFETTRGGTWRLAGCRDYWSKYEHPFHVWPTGNQHDAIDAIELALADYQEMFGHPPAGGGQPGRSRGREAVARGDHRDGQRRAVLVLSFRVIHYRPPRAGPCAHPSEDTRSERLS